MRSKGKHVFGCVRGSKEGEIGKKKKGTHTEKSEKCGDSAFKSEPESKKGGQIRRGWHTKHGGGGVLK